MKIKYIAPLLLVCTSLFGCASAPKLTETDIDPSEVKGRKLTDVVNKYQIVKLDDDFCSNWKAEFGLKLTVCLVKGDYLLYRENSQAYFFIGLKPQKRMVGQIAGRTTYFLSDGGIWVPKNPLHSPRFFDFGVGEFTSFYSTSEAEIQAKYDKDSTSKFVKTYVYNKLGATQKQSIPYYVPVTPIPNNLTPLQSGAAGAVSGAIGGAFIAAAFDDDNVPIPAIKWYEHAGSKESLDAFHANVDKLFKQKIHPFEQ